MSHDAAKKRWDSSHRESDLVVGDWVLLNASNYRFSGTANKLKTASVGPFLVTERIGANAYRLELTPPFHQKHNVFPVSVLRRDTSRTPTPEFVNRRNTEISGPRESLFNEVHDSSEIDVILDERIERTEAGEYVREYLVRWKKISSDYDLWVNEKNIKAPELLRTYRAERRAEGKDMADLPEKQVAEQETPPDNVFEVEKIVKQRFSTEKGKKRKVEYLVRWLNYPPSEDSWVSLEDLDGAPDVLLEWNNQKSQQVLRRGRH